MENSRRETAMFFHYEREIENREAYQLEGVILD